MDKDIRLQQRELIEIMDDFVTAVRTKISDSANISRKRVFFSSKNICELAFGDNNETTEVEPNDFNATIVVVEGVATVDFRNGVHKMIDEVNRTLFVPKNTGFTVTSIAHGSAILTILDQNDQQSK